MIYLNEYTGERFKDKEECVKAEAAYLEKEEKKLKEKEKKNAERKAAAEKVEVARKAMNEAKTAYRQELEDFCRKFGTYHTSLNSDEIPTLFDFFPLW